VRLLFVCTANICRSPSAAALARQSDLPGLEVNSAGTAAATGAQGCPVAPLLEGQSQLHRSQPLTAQLIDETDLVLTAARDHRTEVVALVPHARQRTFTLNQAGRLARWMLDAGILEAAMHPGDVPADDPRAHVTPWSPEDPVAWLVAELDAARGMAGAPPLPEPPRRRWRAPGPPAPHPDDIPDPHELGTQWHGPAAEQITAALGSLLELLGRMPHRTS
jgi:protein-tyrosine-phosphatase